MSYPKTASTPRSAEEFSNIFLTAVGPYNVPCASLCTDRLKNDSVFNACLQDSIASSNRLLPFRIAAVDNFEPVAGMTTTDERERVGTRPTS